MGDHCAISSRNTPALSPNPGLKPPQHPYSVIFRQRNPTSARLILVERHSGKEGLQTYTLPAPALKAAKPAMPPAPCIGGQPPTIKTLPGSLCPTRGLLMTPYFEPSIRKAVDSTFFWFFDPKFAKRSLHKSGALSVAALHQRQAHYCKICLYSNPVSDPFDAFKSEEHL